MDNGVLLELSQREIWLGDQDDSLDKPTSVRQREVF